MLQVNKHCRSLLYVSDTNYIISPDPDIILVTTPITCFNKATDESFGNIVICFNTTCLKERETLIELCRLLKNNRITSDKLILGILPFLHRQLLQNLLCAGVEFVKILDQNNPDFETGLKNFIHFHASQDRTDRVLSKLCPYLNYIPIDHSRELTVCGAHWNRLVLGSHILKHHCETLNHHTCNHFNEAKVLGEKLQIH